MPILSQRLSRLMIRWDDGMEEGRKRERDGRLNGCVRHVGFAGIRFNISSVALLGKEGYRVCRDSQRRILAVILRSVCAWICKNMSSGLNFKEKVTRRASY